jgi:hypothetical protein
MATNRARNRPLLPSRQPIVCHARFGCAPISASARSDAQSRRAHGEIAAHRHHIAQRAPFELVEEEGLVAVVGVRGHCGERDALGTRPVKQVDGDRGLGLEVDVRGNMDLGAPLGITGPVLGKLAARGQRPGDRALGVGQVDRDLAVIHLAQRSRVVTCHPDRRCPLLGEAHSVDDAHPITFGAQGMETSNALVVEGVLVPAHGGHQALERLLRGEGNNLSQGVTVLGRVLREQPGELALHRVAAFAALEVDVERGEKGFQLGQRLAGRLGKARSTYHNP